MTVPPPPGYESFQVGRARVVARAPLVAALTHAMAGTSLHDWASRQPEARALRGRVTAWAAVLPDGVEVVVRHSTHGGLLAPLTSDLFLAPTRAPAELAAALRLAGAGVPTPEVLAYAVYAAVGPFARADVATRWLGGRALPDAWDGAMTSDARDMLVDALVVLLRALRDAGAHHPDLNARNVLVLDASGTPGAAVLDVDRVSFGQPGARGIAEKNVQRLLRSMLKQRGGRDMTLTSQQVARLRDSAGPAA